jgi:NAD(P)-dependent dehydrogenase (short-subunit alcohol dehydrogenase family)
MTTIISDDELFKYAERAKGKVVVLTGGANGIGKEVALAFSEHGYVVLV